MHQFNHPAGDAPVVEVRHLCKTFVLHQQGGIRIQALQDVNFDVRAGECVALHGPSGAGKSTLLKTLYGNYLPSSGQVIVRCEDCETDMATASTRAISRVRRECIGYVSQFLRVIPRVSALDLVAEPLLDAGEDRETALDAAQKMLTRLNLPERLWHVAPATFSGGEQQRVNIARGLIRPMPLLLLDEPTPLWTASTGRWSSTSSMRPGSGAAPSWASSMMMWPAMPWRTGSSPWTGRNLADPQEQTITEA